MPCNTENQMQHLAWEIWLQAFYIFGQQANEAECAPVTFEKFKVI